MEDRLRNLAKYYFKCLYLINDVNNNLKSIQDTNNLEDIKSIIKNTILIISDQSKQCYPDLSPNGEMHTGHLYPEYIALPQTPKTIKE